MISLFERKAPYSSILEDFVELAAIHVLTLEELVDTTFRAIHRAMGDIRSLSLFLLDRERECLRLIRSTEDFGGEIVWEKGSSAFRTLLLSPRMLFGSGPKKSLLWDEEFDRIHADLVVPIRSRGKNDGLSVVGALAVGRRNGRGYAGEEVEFLGRLSHGISMAFENLTLKEQLSDIRFSLNSILQDLGSGVIVVNRRGIVEMFNRSASQILRIDPTAIVGFPYESLNHKIFELIRSVFETKERVTGRVEVYFRRENGYPERRTLFAIASPLYTEKGDFDGVTVVLNDITSLARMEERARVMGRLLSFGALAAGIAHEVRNPLSTIRSFLELLPQKLDDIDFIKGFSSMALEGVQRIEGVVSSLLEQMRPPARAPELEECDVHALLEEILILLEGEVSGSGIEVVTSYRSPRSRISADRASLRQAFMNVILNAIQAMPEGGRLTVSTRKEVRNGESYLVVDIADTGKGIEPEVRDRIFIPFVTTKPDRPGLGLPVASCIVEAHGGFIEVDSVAGRGSIFSIFLPDPK
jgi:two-component system nitrogen regulation sensor histidine kinase GlnL